MLTNPFTGMVINEWTDEARRASAEARRRKAHVRPPIGRPITEYEAAAAHGIPISKITPKMGGMGTLRAGSALRKRLAKIMSVSDAEVNRLPMYEVESMLKESGHDPDNIIAELRSKYPKLYD